ncbi:MAG: ANR family transcriptional regulator [Plesiomonas sp.]
MKQLMRVVRRSQYTGFAQRAVMAEQQKYYHRAAVLWASAANLACREPNRAWAEIRLAFCNNAVKREWGNYYAG